MAQTLGLPDGRKLDYQLSGTPDGFPLVNIHGTAGAYMVALELREACEKKGFKLISFSRAGYGRSRRLRGRKVVDVVDDIDALLKHLGIKKCAVMGHSGGGPHTLACAARLPGCVGALSISGLAPYDAEGLNFLEGNGEDNIVEYNAAQKGEETLAEFCNARRPGFLAAEPAGVVDELSSLLPEVDRKAITKTPGVDEYIVSTFREALRFRVDGWVDDDLAFIDHWGFDLAEIQRPVFLWHGDLDMMVPYAQGKWLATHLPEEILTAHLIQGEGHISISNNRTEEMLDEVLAILRIHENSREFTMVTFPSL